MIDQPQESQLNTEKLLSELHPDMYRIYTGIKSLLELGDNGSIEVHFVHGRIRKLNGVYLKPGIGDEELSRKLQKIT